MAGSLTGTRLGIAKLLQQEGEATVESLANRLGLATATVRRHLDILQRDRLVSFVEVRKATGRPEHSFSLTEEGHETLPKAYDQFLSVLLRELACLEKGFLGEDDGKRVMGLLFERMGRRLAESYGANDVTSNQERLAGLVRVLDERGFSPEVRHGEGSAVLLIYNCPFRSVAREVNQVCLFDQEFISTLLGAPVRRTQSISLGDPCCSYSVGL